MRALARRRLSSHSNILFRFHCIIVKQFMNRKLRFLTANDTYADAQALLYAAPTLKAIPIVESAASMLLVGSCSRARLQRALDRQLEAAAAAIANVDAPHNWRRRRRRRSSAFHEFAQRLRTSSLSTHSQQHLQGVQPCTLAVSSLKSLSEAATPSAAGARRETPPRQVCN